jgi:hypothetical protein
MIGWVKAVILYFVLLGFGIAYFVMGNSMGRVIGLALVFAWVATGIGFVRRLANRFTKPPG